MSTYKLGTLAGGTAGMVDIETLTGYPPQPSEFQEFAEIIGTGMNGAPIESGFAKTVWKWGYLNQTAFNRLRTYCPNNATWVYIATRINTGTTYTYSNFKALMLRPKASGNPGQLRQNVEVQFVMLTSA